MNTRSPKEAIERLEKIADAWEQLAPDVVFGGIDLKSFKQHIANSRAARSEVARVEAERDQKIVSRDNIDANGLSDADYVVNGVIGDRNFGPDSALYEAMGYIRRSARKRGLTRKKKEEKKAA